MIYLLDTHLLLWWLADDPSLSEKGRRLISEATNVILVSAASAWEIAIKKAIGKLRAPEDLERVLSANHIQTLPITVRHALHIGKLPRHHEDPFDRLLIAQAHLEGLTCLTHDKRLKAYGSFVMLA